MRKLTAAFLASLYTTTALSATLLPNGEQQFLDGNGKPYAKDRKSTRLNSSHT